MIPYLDLNNVNREYKADFKARLDSLIETGTFILGSEVDTFEKEFANYCGTDYCIGVGSGLDALTLILKGYINLGRLTPGDKVLVPANTFIATVLSVIHSGLKPVLVEPDESSFNISIEEIRKAYSPEIKAIIPVHLYGHLAAMDPILEFANKNNLIVIEDAAQAHGAINEKGQKAGNLGDAAAFSFYPSKNLGALGDAGGITTNDTALSRELYKLRNYGSEVKNEFQTIGYNSRLDPIQAIFLGIKLNKLDSDNRLRQKIAQTYLTKIKNHKIKLPQLQSRKSHVFYAFVVRVANRNDFLSYISRNEIGYQIHYPIPPHQQLALSAYKNAILPITESIHQTVVSLPLNPALQEQDMQKIIRILNEY